MAAIESSNGNLGSRNYIRYGSELTKVPAGEAEDIQGIVKLFTMLINGDFEKHGHTYPVTHAKTLGVVKGKLIVPEDLPPHLKQSMFAKAGEYPVLMRYSTNNHDVGTADPTSPSRAVTLKIFNVDGDRFEEGAGNRTQEFEMNSSIQVAELADAKTAREMITILMKMGSPRKEDQDAAKAELMARKDLKLQTGRGMIPNYNVAALDFFSQVPHRFGDYVGKHGIVPVSDQQKALLADIIQPTDPASIAASKLQDFYRNNEAVYDWQFQLLENVDEQPIEYAGTVWDPKKYPYQTVARFVFPKQDSFEYELKTYYEDHLRSNMWRGLRSLEPLGSSNRVRRVIYPYASKLREKLNGRRILDIQHIEDLPGPIPEGAQVKRPAPDPQIFHEDHHPEIKRGHLGASDPPYAHSFHEPFIQSNTLTSHVTTSHEAAEWIPGGKYMKLSHPTWPPQLPKW